MLKGRHAKPPAPAGFGDYKEELDSYVAALRRIISYNHAVFGEYFIGVLTQGNDTKSLKTNEAAASTLPNAAGSTDEGNPSSQSTHE